MSLASVRGQTTSMQKGARLQAGAVEIDDEQIAIRLELKGRRHLLSRVPYNAPHAVVSIANFKVDSKDTSPDTESVRSDTS